MTNKRKKEEPESCDCEMGEAIMSTMVHRGYNWCKRCGGHMGKAFYNKDGSLPWGTEVTFHD